ncbi:hypothetical protein CCMA1212_004061 [Trichoderma ghanense]|uniref:Uncharacterized protein n=1 Tax=Trichoderma ghanense TaxID=65468 RepID=A0ABY2H7J1_9HYPO
MLAITNLDFIVFPKASGPYPFFLVRAILILTVVFIVTIIVLVLVIASSFRVLALIHPVKYADFLRLHIHIHFRVCLCLCLCIYIYICTCIIWCNGRLFFCINAHLGARTDSHVIHLALLLLGRLSTPEQRKLFFREV